jgi:hypothetical protein
MATEKLTQNFFERHGGKIEFSGPDDCWLWNAGRFHDGYGRVRVSRKMRRAHRMGWEAENGPIPQGMVIRHKCDTPLCVNPAHLELGTQADNVRDCVERGRSRFGVTQGAASGMAKLTEAAVVAIRADYVRGSLSHGQTAFARKFGVSQPLIGMIIRREIWRHM